MRNKKLSSLLYRYLILILIAFPSLWLFYTIFTPLTIYPVYYILSLFFDVSLRGPSIGIADKFSIEIIKACVAGSAYYLLTILNLSTPNLKLKKRIRILLVSFISFLIINLIRIIVLTIMYYNEFSSFDFAHKLFWYAGSVLMVIVIWFAEVKHYKIKGIPFYSDLKHLFKKIKIKK